MGPHIHRPSVGSQDSLAVGGGCEHVFVHDHGASHPPGDATILHADLDAFYASVEQRDNPSLRGRPVIVGAGVVLAASYEAKAFGIRTAIGGQEARRLCPQAIVVPPRFEAYTEASKAVFEIFRDTTPLVEGISIDEAFLDVGGLRRIAGSPVEIATRLRARIHAEVGLAITVGVARTKFLAKVASAVGKPDGLLVVDPLGELAFLHPLPVERLWGVGKVTAEKLHGSSVHTVGDIADLGEAMMCALLGPGAGRHLFALAMARDPRPVHVGRRRRSIGSQRALGRRPKTEADIEASIVAIADRLGKRLRTAHRVCRTVVLRVRYDDFTRTTRSHTLAEATASTEVILLAARRLLSDAMPMLTDQGCTLIGLSLTNLDNDDAIQLALPFGETAAGSFREVSSGGTVTMDTAALDGAMDDLRNRFGASVLTRAVLLNRSEGMEVPKLPD